MKDLGQKLKTAEKSLEYAVLLEAYLQVSIPKYTFFLSGDLLILLCRSHNILFWTVG